MAERIVIIGGVAAGMSAAAKARRTNRQVEIVVYEKSGYVSYGSCGFPYFIKGEIPRLEKLFARSPEQFAKDGIQVHTHHEVVAIHSSSQTVEVVKLPSAERFTDHYDHLIVATGGHVPRPPIPGVALPGVFSLRAVEDALAIKNWLETRPVRHAVILGAGYLGLEMAEALRAHGAHVSIVEQQPQVLPGFDEDIAALAQAAVEKNGVDVLLNTSVTSFIGEHLLRDLTGRVVAMLEKNQEAAEALSTRRQAAGLSVREAVLSHGTIPADIVILAAGGRPNVALASTAGIALGATGAIAVDSGQRTNLPSIYAAGAAAEAYHRLLDKPIYMPTATVANKQGRVAGANAAGGQAVFPGIVGTSAVKVFDLSLAQAGLTEKQAAAAGYHVNSASVVSTSRAAYMPGNVPVVVKLVYEASSQRLLGAQMAGDVCVAKRIDIVATALQAGWCIKELTELDLSYSPPFAPVWDPLLTAANIAHR